MEFLIALLRLQQVRLAFYVCVCLILRISGLLQRFRPSVPLPDALTVN
jgi:hypothetical protein